jgi:hypothetical protein
MRRAPDKQRNWGRLKHTEVSAWAEAPEAAAPCNGWCAGGPLVALRFSASGDAAAVDDAADECSGALATPTALGSELCIVACARELPGCVRCGGGCS